MATAINELAWLNVGAEVLSPQFCYEEPEDLDRRADLGKKLTSLGVRFNKKHFENIVEAIYNSVDNV